jgi:galactokinase
LKIVYRFRSTGAISPEEYAPDVRMWVRERERVLDFGAMLRAVAAATGSLMEESREHLQLSTLRQGGR